MRSLGALALVALLGCDGPVGSDAGTPGSDGGLAFVEPTPPAPPVFTPCPLGWTAVPSGEGFDVCEPPSGEVCPAGTERFVDEATCAPIGAECPTDEWAAPPEGPVVYVRAGASGGGVGTRVAPYGTIRDAIMRAPPGATVLLARGTYDETIDVYGSLTVLGACARDTILAPSAGAVTVRAVERGITVADVTIRPAGEVRGVEVTGELTLRSVVIEGAADESIFVLDGGSLDASRIAVRDPRAVMPEFGRGLTVSEGSATIEHAIFERCPGSAIVASLGSTVVARAVVAREGGRGVRGAPQLIVQGVGASLELRDSVIEDGVGAGLFVNEDGLLQASQVVIRRHRRDPAAGSTAGVFTRSRARFEGSRLRVEDADFMGLAFLEGSRALVEDGYVARVATSPLDDDDVAFGVLYSGPELTARRLVVRDVERIGVQVENGTVLLEDVSLARTGAGAGDTYQPIGYAQLVGDATLRRVRIAEARGAGIFSLMSTLALEDVAVIETPGIADGRFGRGIEISEGTATLSRVLVEDARELGVHAARGARVEATTLRILSTRGRDCQDTTCADMPGGLGIAAVDAEVTLREFAIDGARLCGVLIAGPRAALDLRMGSIRAATVGACVQVDGYDLSRLTDDVEYRDNGVGIDATDHTVPAPTNPLRGLEL